MGGGRLTALVILAQLAGAGVALAWGPEGHAIVAEVAQAGLTPAAASAVQALLGQEGHQSLDEVASWADAFRVTHPDTAPWHFVDIPLGASGYDAARDCAEDACVVAQIQRFAAVLGDRNGTPPERLEALKFVVHFVGDIHQPLHCEDNADRGGNLVRLSYFGRRNTNLHAVWDDGIIEEALGVRLGPNFTPDLRATRAEAARLIASISPAKAAAWAPPGLAAHLDTATVQWANESHALAREAYDDLPASRPDGWETAYETAAWPIVEDQLSRGGVRLAELLNELLQ